MDALTAMLSQVRRVVTRAGDAQVRAYLHASVSVLEGQTGRLNEALRHCDIADRYCAFRRMRGLAATCSLFVRASHAWAATSTLRRSVLLQHAT